jgi:hypothetical protein
MSLIMEGWNKMNIENSMLNQSDKQFDKQFKASEEVYDEVDLLWSMAEMRGDEVRNEQ